MKQNFSKLKGKYKGKLQHQSKRNGRKNLRHGSYNHWLKEMLTRKNKQANKISSNQTNKNQVLTQTAKNSVTHYKELRKMGR